MLFEIIALVCLRGQDVGDCTKYTAQIYASLGETKSQNSCMLQAQFRVNNRKFLENNPEFAAKMEDDHNQLKFTCEPVSYEDD